MKNQRIIIGIDVSKNTLDLIGVDLERNTIIQPCVIENNTKSIRSWILRTQKKWGQELEFAFENTGKYSFQLAYELNEQKLVYFQLNALDVNRSKGIQRGKSDAADAMMIAQYTLSNRFKLKPSSMPTDTLIELKLLYTQREKIVADIIKYSHISEDEATLPKRFLKNLKTINNSILNNLKKNLKKIENQINEIIKEETEIAKNYKLIQSIPGIGPQTALYLILATKNFTTFKNARQLACYAGVAPFPYQSGTSIRGRNKVSPMADKKLKSLLNMCALTAKRTDKQLNAYWERKIKEEKNKMLILNNIRNKLLSRVFAVINRQQPYVNTHKFAA